VVSAVQVLALSSDGMLARYARSLAVGALWLGAAGLLLAAFGVAIRRGLPPRHASRLTLAVLVALVVFAVVHAFRLRWLADDAFISFRYADNWAHGHGLVYNVGERVEGYTNFLWTAALALGVVVGLHPGHVSLVLSLGCLAATLVVVTRLVRRLLPAGAWLPGALAAAGLAASYVFASFGTSGLETMAAALAVLVAVERAEAGKVALAGLSGVVATMLHPDHVLFYAALGAVVVLPAGSRMRRIALYAAPFVLLFLPYYAARYAYYGDFFPNTFYAKSGGSQYFRQGFVYLGLSGLVAGLYAVIPLAIYGVVLGRKTVFARFVMVGVPLYLVYVAKIGGDFMLGRLLCSVMPPLFVAAELGVRALLARQNVALGAVALGTLAPVALPNGVVGAFEKYLEIADERTFYPLASLFPLEVGSSYTSGAYKFKRLFRKSPRRPRIALGSIGIFGYLTRYFVMDVFGLVNREVAHQKIRERGRPGHEKLATPGHVFASAVDFADIEPWPEEYLKEVSFKVGQGTYWVARYDPRVMKAGRAEGARLPELEERIAHYDASERSSTALACDLWFFDQIYFAYTKDDALRATLGAAVRRAVPSYSGLEALLVGELPERDRSWTRKQLFSFDDLASWSVRGEAFVAGPVEREVGTQARVFGAKGRFVNSYVRSLGDRAKGSLRSPKFRLSGDALTLSVGGGRSRRVFVRLLVGDEVVASATGCGTDALGRRVFPTASHRGREAELEIVDRGDAGWDHLLVDEVVEWTLNRP
jgi:hypothetical protein